MLSNLLDNLTQTDEDSSAVSSETTLHFGDIEGLAPEDIVEREVNISLSLKYRGAKPDPITEELAAKMLASYQAGETVDGEDLGKLILGLFACEDAEEQSIAIRFLASALMENTGIGISKRAISGNAKKAAKKPRQPAVSSVELIEEWSQLRPTKRTNNDCDIALARKYRISANRVWQIRNGK